MMSEEISSERVYKTRSALGDITNQSGKRGVSFISSSDVKARDGSVGYVEMKTEESQIAKKVCARTENLVKEGMACVSPHPSCEIDSLKRNAISGISENASEIKETGLVVGVVQIGGTDAITDNIVNLGDDKKDNCLSKIPLSMVSCDKDEIEVISDIHKDKELISEVGDGNELEEKIETSVCGNNENDFNSNKDDCVEFSRFPETQESEMSVLERCIGLKGDGCSNSSEGVDLIKACSCSFCTKAAYIWSDLHYQDMKGRIAALKKSQKEASILVQRSSRENGREKRGQGNSNKVSRLESDLTGHWTSLFLRTEDILVRECSQLEANLLTLKDLRDNCKTELELMTGVPADTE